MTMDDRPHDPLDARSAGSSGRPEASDDVDLVASALVDGEPLPPGADVEHPDVQAAVAAFQDVADRVGAPGEAVVADRAAIRAAIETAATDPAPGGEARVISLASRRHAVSTRAMGVAAALLLAVGIGALALRDDGDGQRELSTAGHADSAGSGVAKDETRPPADATQEAPGTESAGGSAADESAVAAAPQAPPSTVAPAGARAAAGLVELGDLDSVAAVRAAVQQLLAVTDTSEFSSLERRPLEARCATAVAAIGTPVAVGRLEGRDVVAVVSLTGDELTVLHLDDCTIAEG